ncbi:MAG: DUF1611 domain-containing protein [Candidatus Glassbacteria bacterium]
MKKTRTVLLCEGAFDDFGTSKTAYGVLRFTPESVVAVIDSRQAGKDCAEVSGLGRGIPVVASLDEALCYKPDRLLIGIATVGGVLPRSLRSVVARALEAGLEVHNGLHEMLADDPLLAEAARRNGAKIVDLRREPENLDCGTCLAQQVPAFVVLTVGTDCNTGKMTTAIEVARGAQKQGIKARFCATGQTGIAIEGWGIAVDHVLSDFTAGAAERLVVEAGREDGVKLILVEGQGALAQPVYSGVTLSLMHGCLPDAMILSHRVTQHELEIVRLPMPPLPDHVRLYEEAMRLVKPARVIALSLNTRGLDEDSAREEIRKAGQSTGLPVTDPARFGVQPLLDAIRATGLKKIPLYAGPGN